MHARIALVCLIIGLALAAGTAVASWVPAATPAAVSSVNDTTTRVASEFSPSLDELTMAIEAAVLAPETLMEPGPMVDDSLAWTSTTPVTTVIPTLPTSEAPNDWAPEADVAEPAAPRATANRSGGIHLIVLAPVVVIALAILMSRRRSALAG
ncbi:MAG: hypothetical protein FJX36_05790 [Alphaproteobacteria bacterium]|nr:hypothetical protein [Alphaproteobacteria bacterium]